MFLPTFESFLSDFLLAIGIEDGLVLVNDILSEI